MSKNRFISILLIIVVLGAVFFISKKRSQKKVVPTTAQIQEKVGVPVQTAQLQLGKIADTVAVTGDLAALDSTTLSSKIQGKVAFVSAQEGDAVRRGQVIVQIDQSDAESGLRQAEAGLASANAGLVAAQARLSQAETTKKVTDVQSSSAIQSAQAGLSAAQSNLQKVKTGARSQEKMMAENQVSSAKANMDNAQASLRRSKQLVAQGALSQAQLDVSQTQFDVAQAQYNSAKENLSLVQEGARSEDVRSAEAMVSQAEEALRSAKANAAQTALRQEDINSAKAAVLQARAAVQQAKAMVSISEEMLKNTSIVSPIDGFMAKRMTEPGQMATPGVALAQVVDLHKVYFQADISETVISKIKPGQTVGVKVDAFPDELFNGRVSKINPTASGESRDFSVRVTVSNPGQELKPGMFARGSVIAGNDTTALLVPQDAVEERAGQFIVFTVEGNTVKRHTIVKGKSNPEFIEVKQPTDLKPMDTVVTSGHESLKKDGDRVYMPDAGRQAAAD